MPALFHDERYRVPAHNRGEQHEGSDLDLLVDLDRPVSFFEFLELEEELGRRLGLRVELVTRPALKPFIGDRILR